MPGAKKEARRNDVEMETNKDKSSSFGVTCDDVRCFSWTVLGLNWFCAICTHEV